MDVELVNGRIVHFYGFADSDGKQQTGRIITAPAFMLVKVPGTKVKIRDFPVGVVPLRRASFKFRIRKTSTCAKYRQFPVTLAYAITDYKCQGETFSRRFIN
jgi:hypothetical protein